MSFSFRMLRAEALPEGVSMLSPKDSNVSSAMIGEFPANDADI